MKEEMQLSELMQLLKGNIQLFVGLAQTLTGKIRLQVGLVQLLRERYLLLVDCRDWYGSLWDQSRHCRNYHSCC